MSVESTYYHTYNLTRSMRGFMPAEQLHAALVRDWLGCSVFTLYKLLEYNNQWLVMGDFISEYAAKCMGRKLSPWSTDATHYLHPFTPTKKFKLFIVTERGYTSDECLDFCRRATFHSHPGLERIEPGETDFSVCFYYDNGLGETRVTVRFIATTTPVFDVDLLALSIFGFEIFHSNETIPILVGKELTTMACLMYKPLVIERLIENICSGMANIIAVPLAGEDNYRQRRWISRQLTKAVENQTYLLNPPYVSKDYTETDNCVICHCEFGENNEAVSLCHTCNYLAHQRCVFEYISSRLQTNTFITCLTCREELPLWRQVIMDTSNFGWDKAYTETTVSESDSSEGILGLESDEELPFPSSPDSIPPLESDTE